MINVSKVSESSSNLISNASPTASFSSLDLIAPLLRALSELSYHAPSPIQAKAIPEVLAGKDLLACAQTGTGKTAAFALPTLQRLEQTPRVHKTSSAPRALVLAPTRELALQIFQSFHEYGRYTGLRSTAIFGGVNQGAQVTALKRHPAILIATTGRLLDLISQGYVSLASCEILVLDEADRMLDMGFIRDIRKIATLLPKERQTLLFSATMPPEIRKLAQDILKEPVEIAVAPVSSTAEKIEQQVYFVNQTKKTALLEHLLKNTPDMTKTLVFTRTKRGANRVATSLNAAGFKTEAIHGNKSQSSRQRSLGLFRDGKISVLVASDLAARGLDVEDITHVINYDLPEVAETYVHRIGRTGRAKASGTAIAFCDRAEQGLLNTIERLTRKKLTKIDSHPFPMDLSVQTPIQPPARSAGARPSSARSNSARRPRSFANRRA